MPVAAAVATMEQPRSIHPPHQPDVQHTYILDGIQVQQQRINAEVHGQLRPRGAAVRGLQNRGTLAVDPTADVARRIRGERDTYRIKQHKELTNVKEVEREGESEARRH